MTDDRVIWDDAYRRRRQLYGGAPPPVPKLSPHARILELGCGNGKNTGLLLGRGHDVVALDFSQAAIAAARSCQDRDGPGHVILADARAIPLRAGSCDAVLARHLVGHLTRDGRNLVAGEIHRVLRTGGLLHFSAFSQNDFRYGEGDPVEDGTFLRGNGIFTHYFTAAEATSLFSSLSCQSVTEHTWGLRVRGRDLRRSEIHAVFIRSLP